MSRRSEQSVVSVVIEPKRPLTQPVNLSNANAAITEKMETPPWPAEPPAEWLTYHLVHPGHALLAKIQRLFITTIHAGVLAAGGEENITTTDYPAFRYPEGWKGHVSDDICLTFGPAIYREFSAPYDAQVFAEFGAGDALSDIELRHLDRAFRLRD